MRFDSAFPYQGYEGGLYRPMPYFREYVYDSAYPPFFPGGPMGPGPVGGPAVPPVGPNPVSTLGNQFGGGCGGSCFGGSQYGDGSAFLPNDIRVIQNSAQGNSYGMNSANPVAALGMNSYTTPQYGQQGSRLNQNYGNNYNRGYGTIPQAQGYVNTKNAGNGVYRGAGKNNNPYGVGQNYGNGYGPYTGRQVAR